MCEKEYTSRIKVPNDSSRYDHYFELLPYGYSVKLALKSMLITLIINESVLFVLQIVSSTM